VVIRPRVSAASSGT